MLATDQVNFPVSIHPNGCFRSVLAVFWLSSAAPANGGRLAECAELHDLPRIEHFTVRDMPRFHPRPPDVQRVAAAGAGNHGARFGGWDKHFFNPLHQLHQLAVRMQKAIIARSPKAFGQNVLQQQFQKRHAA